MTGVGMFDFEVAPTFEATVRIVRAGGRADDVRVTFNYLVGEPYQALVEETRALPAAQFLGRLIAGWETRADPAGRWVGMPEAYSPAALEKLLRLQPRAGRCLMAAYNHEVHGFALGN